MLSLKVKQGKSVYTFVVSHLSIAVSCRLFWHLCLCKKLFRRTGHHYRFWEHNFFLLPNFLRTFIKAWYKNGKRLLLLPIYVMRCEFKNGFFKSKLSTESLGNKVDGRGSVRSLSLNAFNSL